MLTETLFQITKYGNLLQMLCNGIFVEMVYLSKMTKFCLLGIGWKKFSSTYLGSFGWSNNMRVIGEKIHLLSLNLLLKQWTLYINKMYYDIIRMTKGERSNT